MKSRLTDAARRGLSEDLRRMTAEQRLAAYVVHCQFMAELRLAGRTGRQHPTNPTPRHAD